MISEISNEKENNSVMKNYIYETDPYFTKSQDGKIEVLSKVRKFDPHIKLEDDEGFNLIWNDKFYVDIFSDLTTTKRFMRCLLRDGFANRIPVTSKETFNRGVTHIIVPFYTDPKLNLNCYKTLEDILAKELRYDELKTNLTIEIMKHLKKLLLEPSEEEFEKNKTYSVFYIDIFSNIFNYHRLMFSNYKNKYGLFDMYEVPEQINKTDYQLNFAEKVNGVVCLSALSSPFTIGDYLFMPVVGSMVNITNDGAHLSFMGSIFTNELFENYPHYRILLEIDIKPLNDNPLFKDKERFELFQSLAKKSDPTSESTSLDPENNVVFVPAENMYFKISDIYVEIDGSGKDSYDKSPKSLSQISSDPENIKKTIMKALSYYSDNNDLVIKAW